MTRPTPPRAAIPKAVTVRIAVAVDSDGRWDCYGHGDLESSTSDAVSEHLVRAGSHLNPPVRVVFLEADVQLADKPETLRAEVKP